MISLKT